MPITGSRITQIGEGAAQILPTYKSDFGEDIAKQNRTKQAVKQKREEDIYGDLGKVSYAGIFAPHQQIFAQKQKELYDYTKQNIDKLRSGDAQTNIEFQQKLSKLGYDIGQSKNVRQSYEKYGNDLVANPDKYESESGDYLHNVGQEAKHTYDAKTDQFNEVDPKQMQQKIDFEKGSTPYVQHLPEMLDKKTESGFDKEGNVWKTQEGKMSQDKLHNIATAMTMNPTIVSWAVKKAKKDGTPIVPDKYQTDEQGNVIKDANGAPQIDIDAKGNPLYGTIHQMVYNARNLQNFEKNDKNTTVNPNRTPGEQEKQKTIVNPTEITTYEGIPGIAGKQVAKDSYQTAKKPLLMEWSLPDGSSAQGLSSRSTFQDPETNKIYSQILIPSKSLALPSGFGDETPENQAEILSNLQQQQPDKFERKNIIISGNEKNKGNLTVDSNGQMDVNKMEKRKLDATKFRKGYSTNGEDKGNTKQGKTNTGKSPKMITVTVGSNVGQIPEDQWNNFKKKNPTATK